MDLEDFFKPDKEKLKITGIIITASLIFIIAGVYFSSNIDIGDLWFLPALPLIVVYYFYIPVVLFMGLVYNLVSWRPDMDTMTSSQFIFHFGSMFVIGIFYTYFISCMIVFVQRKKRATGR